MFSRRSNTKNYVLQNNSKISNGTATNRRDKHPEPKQRQINVSGTSSISHNHWLFLSAS